VSDQIAELIRDLLNSDESTRRFAVEDLGDLGDVRAVEPLIPVLFDPVPAIREAAVDALKAIGGEETVSAVVPALRTDNAAVRNAASEILQAIGEPAIPQLEKLLEDDDKDVRKFAVDIMTVIGSPLAEKAFVRALEDRDVNVSAAAAEALGEIGSHASVEPLVQSLKASSWTRCSVAKSLGQIGGAEAARALQQLTRDDDPMVVFTAVEALGSVRDPAAIESLLPLLKHENQLIVNKAIASIEQIEDDIPPDVWNRLRGQISVDSIVALLRDPAATLRHRAAALLGQIGAEEAVKPLVHVLLADENREDDEIRELAIRSIVSLAPQDIRSLLDALDDDSVSVEGRCELIDLLAQLGRPEAFDAVVKFADDTEVQLQRVVARVIMQLDAERAVVPLRKALHCSDSEVRINAARGLGTAHQDIDEVVHDLARLLDDLDPEVQQVAAKSLASIGTDQALEALVSAARGEEVASRLAAVQAMAEVPALPAVDRILTAALGDASADICAAAIHSLAARGEVAVTDQLLGCLDSPASNVRRATVQLLARQKQGAWAVRLLNCFREDPDPQVRHDCALALAAFSPPGTVELLIEKLDDDPHPLVALGAMEALGRIGDERAESVLDRLLASDDPEIAEAAAHAIGSIAGRCVGQT